MPAFRVLRIFSLPVLLLGLLLGSAGCSTEPPLPKGNSHALVFGAVVPLSGPEALKGRSIQHGLELAVAEVNAAGGVNGHPVTLGIIDTQGDLTEGYKALLKWRDLGVPVIIVADTSLAIEHAVELSDYPQTVAFLNDYVAALSLTPKNGVRLWLNGDQEGRLIEGYLAAAGVNKTTILFAGSPIGASNAKYLDFLLQGDYISTRKDSYTANIADYRLLAEAMTPVGADSMVLVGYGPEYANILAAFSFAKWNGLVLGYLGQPSLAGLGGQTGLAAKLLYPVPAYVINPLGTRAAQAFAKHYNTLYGKDPDLYAAYAYDTIRALAAGAARSASVLPAKIREGYIGLKSYTGAAGNYTIMPDGDTEMPLQLVNGNGQVAPPPPKPTRPPELSHSVSAPPGLGASVTQEYFYAVPNPADTTTGNTTGNSTASPSGNSTTPASTATPPAQPTAPGNPLVPAPPPTSP